MVDRALVRDVSKAGVYILRWIVLAAVAASLFTAPASSQRARRKAYTDFPHAQKAHQKECSTCHTFPSPNWKTVRPATEAFPDVTEYPEHQSCVGCHRQQFFKGTRPNICTICHIAPSPRGGPRHPFPNPREVFDTSKKAADATSDWSVSFPHDKHVEIVSRTATRRAYLLSVGFVRPEPSRPLPPPGEESCAVCHQTMAPQGASDDEYLTKPPADIGDKYWLKKGTFKSAPIGHKTCFTCHSAETGILPEPKDCAVCHKPPGPKVASDLDRALVAKIGSLPRPMLEAWTRRSSAGTFRHEAFAHVDLPCSTCHNVSAMKTEIASTLRVPVSACATCHATATADDGGVLNYEANERAKDPKFECTKCHIAFGRMAIPVTHVDATKAAGGK